MLDTYLRSKYVVAMSSANNQLPHLLTVAETARLLGVSDYTVRRWAHDGELPYIQLPGGQRRIRRVDVDAILTPRINVDGESRVFRTAVS